MSAHDDLARLRPRDLDVVRALVEHVTLKEKQLADVVGMSLSTLKSRLRHAYVVLGVSSRVELFARYHAAILADVSAVRMTIAD